MTIRKFGTAEDQKVEVDDQDEQGLSKSALKRIAALKGEDEDLGEWESEGGNGSNRK